MFDIRAAAESEGNSDDGCNGENHNNGGANDIEKPPAAGSEARGHFGFVKKWPSTAITVAMEMMIESDPETIVI